MPTLIYISANCFRLCADTTTNDVNANKIIRGMLEKLIHEGRVVKDGEGHEVGLGWGCCPFSLTCVCVFSRRYI